MTPIATSRLQDVLPMTRRRPVAGGLLGRLTTTPMAMLSRARRAWREHLAIGKLMAMSDHGLKDIGLTRGDVPFAVRTGVDRPWHH